ncbi:hypothetical protein [Flavobacterium sp. LAR06]|uniref:hypothetical protein n=1 Tax=Flavobacterium sp. LAR06 TaxID=3064897 RepID=UPI0035BF19A4
MNLQILDFFPVKSTSYILDNFSIYELKFIAFPSIEKISDFTQSSYDKFNSQFNSFGYEWSLEIVELNYSINQNRFIKIDVDDIDGIEELNLTFQVFKKTNNIYVFNQVKFIENIKNTGLNEVLKIFNSKFLNGFIIYNHKRDYKFSSNYIGYNLELKTEVDCIEKISNQCHFTNFSDFKFTPNNFNIGDFNKDDEIIHWINKVYLIFILIYIFDRSEISQNEIKLKISGFKTIEYDLIFDDINIDSIEIYEKIFLWIYSEKNKIEDKIGIARNILSIYLKSGSLKIDDNTFNSILSANNTYIKGNISKYIEARNKIHEQIEQVSNKVNSSLEIFYNNFQKSIFVFISFYLTIFVLKVYTKNDVTSLINKEATIMALGLLTLSFLFLLFSVWILSLEKGRINQKYINIKDRSLDLLLKEDIDIILKNDSEYNDEIKFLNKRRDLYIILWISTLIVFLAVLFTTSDYINFKYIKDNKPIEKVEIIKDKTFVPEKQIQPQSGVDSSKLKTNNNNKSLLKIPMH